MARPVIAWLTDFGTSDHYVAAMKGVALSVAPEATLVDITHGIPPQDVLSAALELLAVYRFYPPDTVFVCVVDPGVGSPRRALAVRAGGYTFVAPDNGVLMPALEQIGRWEAVQLTSERHALGPVSRTFEGRDRFAPAAAWLAAGTPLDALGPAVFDPVPLRVPEPVVTPGGVNGEVLRIDHFGNAITNIAGWMFRDVPTPVVRVANAVIDLVGTYADCPAGTPCSLIGSSGYLEVAVSQGRASSVLGLERGTSVSVGPSGA